MAGNRKNPSPHPVAPVLHVPLWASSREELLPSGRGRAYLAPAPSAVPSGPGRAACEERLGWVAARLAGCGSSPRPRSRRRSSRAGRDFARPAPAPAPPGEGPGADGAPMRSAGRREEAGGFALGPTALRCAAPGSALVGARQDRQADARLPPPPPGLRGRPEVRQRPTPLCKALGGAANSCLPSRGGGGGHKCELRPGNSIGPTKQARPDSTAYNEPRRPLS